MKEVNEMQSGEYLDKSDFEARELDFFMSDTGAIRQRIEADIMRMKELGEQYETLDHDEEIRNFIEDLL